MANKIYKLGGTAEEINGVLTDLVDARTDEFDGQYLKVVTEDGETHIVADYASTKDGVGRVDETPDAENHGEIFNYYPDDAGASVDGIPNKATGKYSHAEGYQTAATGDNSHSEGNHTVAAGDNQHVSGKYNVEDNENKYAVIVGNGNENRKSNALTVDWDGNINCGITDPNGEQISYGTINGVDITTLPKIDREAGEGIIIEGEIFDAKYAKLKYIDLEGDARLNFFEDDLWIEDLPEDQKCVFNFRCEFEFNDTSIDQNLITIGDGTAGTTMCSYTDGTLKTSFIDKNNNTDYIMHNPKSSSKITELHINNETKSYDEEEWRPPTRPNAGMVQPTYDMAYEYKDKEIEENKTYILSVSNIFRTEKYAECYGGFAYGCMIYNKSDWLKSVVDNSYVSITSRLYECNEDNENYPYFITEPCIYDEYGSPSIGGYDTYYYDSCEIRNARLVNLMNNENVVRFADIEISSEYDNSRYDNKNFGASEAYGKLKASDYGDIRPKINADKVTLFDENTSIRFKKMRINSKESTQVASYSDSIKMPNGTELLNIRCDGYADYLIYKLINSQPQNLTSTAKASLEFPLRGHSDIICYPTIDLKTKKVGLFLQSYYFTKFIELNQDSIKSVGEIEYYFNEKTNTHVYPQKEYNGTKINVKPATQVDIGGVIVKDGLDISPIGELGLAKATETEIGGLKVGKGFVRKDDGELSVNPSLGHIIKPDEGIEIECKEDVKFVFDKIRADGIRVYEIPSHEFDKYVFNIKLQTSANFYPEGTIFFLHNTSNQKVIRAYFERPTGNYGTLLTTRMYVETGYFNSSYKYVTITKNEVMTYSTDNYETVVFNYKFSIENEKITVMRTKENGAVSFKKEFKNDHGMSISPAKTLFMSGPYLEDYRQNYFVNYLSNIYIYDDIDIAYIDYQYQYKYSYCFTEDKYKNIQLVIRGTHSSWYNNGVTISKPFSPKTYGDLLAPYVGKIPNQLIYADEAHFSEEILYPLEENLPEGALTFKIKNIGVLDVTSSDEDLSLKVHSGAEDKTVKLKAPKNLYVSSDKVSVINPFSAEILKEFDSISDFSYSNKSGETYFLDTGFIYNKPNIRIEVEFYLSSIGSEVGNVQDIFYAEYNSQPIGIFIKPYNNSNVEIATQADDRIYYGYNVSSYYYKMVCDCDSRNRVIYKTYRKRSSSDKEWELLGEYNYGIFLSDKSLNQGCSSIKIFSRDGITGTGPVSAAIRNIKIYDEGFLRRYYIFPYNRTLPSGQKIPANYEYEMISGNLELLANRLGYGTSYRDRYIQPDADYLQISLNTDNIAGHGMSVNEDSSKIDLELMPENGVETDNGIKIERINKIGEYTLIESITSIKCGYIDTEYVPTSKTDIEIDCLIPLETTGGYEHILGAKSTDSANSSSGNQEFLISSRFGGATNAVYGYGNDKYASLPLIYGRRFKLTTSGTQITIYDYEKELINIVNFNERKSDCTTSLALFCAHNKIDGTEEYSSLSNLTLYSFKIYENGKLVKDYQPCIDSMGGYGIIDKISEEYILASPMYEHFKLGNNTNKTIISTEGIVDSISGGKGISISNSSTETYKLVEKVVFESTSGLIDTDINLKSKKHHFDFKWKRSSTSTSSVLFTYGSPNNLENSYRFGLSQIGGSPYYRNLAFYNPEKSDYAKTENDPYTLCVKDSSTLLYEGSTIVEQNKLYSSLIGEKTIEHDLIPSETDRITLFGTYYNTSLEIIQAIVHGSRDEFYYLDIYDDDTLVAKLRPAMRLSDNVAGILNLLDNKFYTPSGNGSFVAMNETGITIKGNKKKGRNNVTITNNGILDITTSTTPNRINVTTAYGQKTVDIKNNINSIFTSGGLSINQLKSEFTPSEQTYSTQAVGSTLTSSGNPIYPYFDTGVPASSGVKIEMILTIPRPTYDTIDGIYRAVPSALFGAKISDNDIWGTIIDTSYTIGIYGPGSGSSPLATYGYPFGSRAKLTLDKERYRFEMLNTDNSVSYEFANISINMPEFKSDNTIHILHVNGMDNILGSGYSSIESIKIYNAGSLVRWYVPAIAWMSGSYNACFYDVLNQTKSFSLRDGVKFNFSTFDAANRTFLEPGINQLSLTPSTTSTIGGVIVGDGLTVDNDGKVSIKDYNALLARIEELERLAGITPST